MCADYEQFENFLPRYATIKILIGIQVIAKSAGSLLLHLQHRCRTLRTESKRYFQLPSHDIAPLMAPEQTT
jgi:hypothetical protein